MPEINNIVSFAENGILVSVKMYRKEELSKACKLVVTTHFVAFLEKNGVLYQTLQPGEYKLFDKSENGVFRKRSDIDSLRIIFVAKNTVLQMKWGTQNAINVWDTYTKSYLKLKTHGEFGFRINNAELFFKKIISNEGIYTSDDLKNRMLSLLLSKLTPILTRVVINNNYNFAVFELYKDKINKQIQVEMNDVFNEYGMELNEFFISDLSFVDDEQLENLKKALANMLTRESNETIKCPGCNKSIPPLSTFCNYCGKKIQIVKTCQCGKANPTDSKFCNSCGKAI